MRSLRANLTNRRVAAVFAALLLGAAAAALPSCTDTNNNAPITAGGGSDQFPPPDGGRGDGSGGPDAGDDVGSTPIAEAPALWFAGGSLNAFTRSELRASNDRGPGVIVSPAYPASGYHDLAFDAGGNLWTLPRSGDRILRIPAAQLGATSIPEPDLVITSAALLSAQSLTFDAAGNLWVMSYAGAGIGVTTVGRFDDPRAASGNVGMSPSLLIGPGTSVDGVARLSQGTTIAFDAAGNLWLATASSVLRLGNPSEMFGEKVAAPTAIIDGAGGAAYVSMAFDAAGALWLTAAGSGYFAIRIDDPGSLSGRVSPVPGAKVRLPAGTDTLFAGGLAFDADGALWIAMTHQILKLAAPGALAGQVTAQPTVVLGLTAAPDLASKLVIR